jgi:nucleotide-binding universal stress UspA family protein
MAIARLHQSTVSVVHVFAPVPLAAVGLGPMGMESTVLPPIDQDQLLAETRAFVDQERAPGVIVEAAVRGGNPVQEILEEAVRGHADLIVIGTHGRSGFEHLLLGSVAEKVLRKATCPVMTVPKDLPDAVPAGPIFYKSILCPVDFSEWSLRALQYATAMAEAAHGQLTVMHVDEPEFADTPGMATVAYEAGMTLGDFLEEHKEASQRRLEDTTRNVPAHCTVDTLVTRGKPWREVLRIAAERQSELIVMGVHGRGVVDRLFFGSTTEHVVRAASCPVLTLRG